MVVHFISTNEISQIIDLSDLSKGNYNFVKGIYGSSNWITDPARGSNYRYCSYVFFSSDYNIYTLQQNYYWYARAEQKKWGTWATRNDYKPIWGFNSQWNFEYKIVNKQTGYVSTIDGNSPENFLSNTNNRPTSPYYLSNLNTNYTVRYLYPHGYYSIPSYWPFYIFDNVRIYYSSYSSSFTGGASGYSYALY
jgi:hypothetical protein